MLIDTNIIIRLITGEPAAQAAKVKKVFQAAADGGFTLKIKPMILAESVFVLDSFYGFARKDISNALTRLLQSVEVECAEKEQLIVTLELFAQKKLDFVDCYLGAHSLTCSEEILSFDKDFKKVAGVKQVNPTTYKP